MSRERGAVLLEVLVVTTIAMMMCATLLRARLQPALTSASDVERLTRGLEDQAALNRVTEVWARLGACSSDARSGVSCAGAGCACDCAVSTAAAGPAVKVVSSPSSGACALTVAGQ